ncbi:Arginine N-succinyltransferase [Stieleria maiorica]|uniref:Arginine N-succinyltransferase n=1 Tax=Stieleria maiorica TaxID=2795974 RepID=A0A5B9MMU4_9BACT|nr:arginine N-succinyltransferase [Stieleria maiorica]QEG01237.1 Arginine N-succinyltransferase [Stieleria maiorica]
MHHIRLVRPADLDALFDLAGKSTYGLTTLTPDRDRLAMRIEESETGESPLLVWVEGAEQRLIGTAGLFTHVGDSSKGEPFYAFRLERSIHRSEALNVRTEVDTLHLAKIFDGPTELGTLFLDPQFRGGGKGRVLSLSRFMLIARDPEHYDRQVIAEMRGVIDQDGRSPFWDAVGRHFFKVDFPIADTQSFRDKRFIAELMPSHPIYVPLLPEQAREVIGKVHTDTEPALRLLESEGFHEAQMVDIFDGGPCIRCDRKAIRTILESSRVELTGVFPASQDAKMDTLVATADGPFRCIGGATRRTADGIQMLPSDIESLGVSVGDSVIVSPLKGTAKAFWNDKTANQVESS